MPELSGFERIAYADQCTNTSEIISVKALDNMILVFSIFLSPHRHSYPSIFNKRQEEWGKDNQRACRIDEGACN